MIRRVLRQQLPLIAAALLLTALQCAMELRLPQLMADTVNNGIMRGDLQMLAGAGRRMLAVSVIMGAAGYGASMICVVAGERLSLGLRREAYEKIHTLSVRQVSAMGQGTLITLLNVDVDVCSGLVHALILFLAEPLFLMAGGIVMMWIISWRLGLVFIVFAVTQLALMLVFIRYTAPDYIRIRHITDALNARLQDALNHFRMTKAYNAQPTEKTRFEENSTELFRAMYRVQRKIAVFNPLIMLVMNMAVAVVLWFSGKQVSVGGMSVGTVLSAITYSEQVLLAIAACGRMYKVITEAQPSSARFFRLIDAQPEMPDGCLAEEGPFRELRFDGVDFAYPGGEKTLDSVSFSVSAGEIVAVVGPVGSGKTALAGLCVRMHDATGGRVLLNGRDIRTLRMRDVRRITALAEKNSAILEGTVSENIVFGRDGIDEAAVLRAISAAQLSGYLESSPGGLDTRLGSMGTNLSGGERQRFTIARALAGGPGLLVLDDSTSSLDYETERRLLSALREQYDGMAVILVTNRSVSAARADRILVLDGGRVIAEGSDSALRETCELYRQMCAAQGDGKM